MHIEEMGSGPALVLLHGSPTSVDALAPVAEAFAPTRRVLTPHLPGYGRTPADPAPVSLTDQARRLEEALLARGVRECAVVGLSLGGYRALQLAASPRLEVTHAVLLGAFANFDAPAREAKRQLAAVLRAGALDLPALLPGLFLPPAAVAANGPAVREIAGWAAATTLENLANEQAALATMDDLTQVLPRLRAAVVARVGGLDAALPPPFSEEICRAVPGATLEVVPGCGHALLLEDREGTIASIRRALARD